MTLFVMIGGGLFFLTSSLVGFRLFALAYKNRTLPELALAIAFVVGGTLGGSLSQYLQMQSQLVSSSSVSPSLLGQLTFVSGVFSVVGITMYNVFTWRVFRANSISAAALVAVIFASGLAMMLWAGVSGVYSTGALPSQQRMIQSLMYSIGPLWATIEAFRYHGQIARRLKLGMADPVIANRILLWGVGSLLATTIVMSSVLLTVIDTEHPAAILNGLIMGLCGSMATVVYALAFFPPKAYIAYLTTRAPAPAA